MSLKKIAQMTGASVSTVSRVLNSPDYQCQDSAMTERIRRLQGNCITFRIRMQGS